AGHRTGSGRRRSALAVSWVAALRDQSVRSAHIFDRRPAPGDLRVCRHRAARPPRSPRGPDALIARGLAEISRPRWTARGCDATQCARDALTDERTECIDRTHQASYWDFHPVSGAHVAIGTRNSD